MDGDLTNDTFYVTDDNGSRVDDPYDLANIEQVITVVLNAHFLKSSGAPRPADKDPTNLMPDGSSPSRRTSCTRSWTTISRTTHSACRTRS